MTIRPIRTERDYQKALSHMENIFDAKAGTPEADERLELMLHWDVNNGIARRSWARNDGALDAIRREMERTPLLKVTLPNLVNDQLLDDL